MSDFIDHEILNTGLEKQIIELNKTIISLRSKVSELESEITARDMLPIPKTIVSQIMEMEALIRKQENDLQFYKKYVPVQVIINRENAEKPTRSGGIKKSEAVGTTVTKNNKLVMKPAK